MEKLISIYNNPQRGYVFCASTTILNKKLHTNVRPIIMLPLEEISEENICIELEEKEDKYFYQYYVYYKQGCYTGTCHWYERDYVNNNISNKELGHHIIEQMNSLKGQN